MNRLKRDMCCEERGFYVLLGNKRKIFVLKKQKHRGNFGGFPIFDLTPFAFVQFFHSLDVVACVLSALGVANLQVY